MVSPFSKAIYTLSKYLYSIVIRNELARREKGRLILLLNPPIDMAGTYYPESLVIILETAD